MEKVKSCNICGSNNYEVKYTINVEIENPRFYRYAKNMEDYNSMTGQFNIVKCNNCSLHYTNPRFDKNELEILYSKSKGQFGAWKNFPYLFNSKLPDVVEKKATYKSKNYQWKIDLINKHIGELKPCENNQVRLLDIGCGDGAFVHCSMENGFDAYGVDLSEHRIEDGKKKYGLKNRLICADCEDLEPATPYDVITLWDLFEHLTDPSSFLLKIRKLTHKNTKIFILTMSLDSITYKVFKKNWYYMNPTQHLFFFSDNTINKILQKNNYQLIDKELDNSKDKNIFHLIARIIIGQINRIMYKVYAYNKFSMLRKLLNPFHKGIDLNRMKLRIQNIYPGVYVGRYHDNFVYIAKPKPV